MDFISSLHCQTPQPPRPGLHPIPGSVPLTLEAVICPPVIYYLALLFLPPAPPPALDNVAIKLLRSALALLAGYLFFRLPLVYHVPQSIGLTYQLGLVGLYGGCRVLDAFFISPFLLNHIPRRVKYTHADRAETPGVAITEDTRPPPSSSTSVSTKPNTSQRRSATANSSANEINENVSSKEFEHENTRRSSLTLATDSYFLLKSTLEGPSLHPVTEHATSEDGWPHSFLDCASWALELELSMRGVGFTWTTADVRHTRKTWLPTVRNRLHSIFIHVLPTLLVCFAIIRSIYVRYFSDEEQYAWPSSPVQKRQDIFDERLPLGLQLLLTTALGAFLMSAFSLAHSAFAIVCAPLAPSPLAFFPPLYTTRVWSITSVRQFWSYGWHRLFARFFLVYGVWPGEWLERKLLGKGDDEKADEGKVLGGFVSSAFCHSFAVRGVLGGEWKRATGEAVFFGICGAAVLVEEGVMRVVMERRRRSSAGGSLMRWYDGWIGRIWWITVLLFSGRSFARGWVNAGLVREMAAM